MSNSLSTTLTPDISGKKHNMTFAPRVIEYVLDDDNRSAISANLDRYFRGTGRAAFSGRRFDDLAAESDPYCFTATDIAAVCTLSVPLTGQAVAQLLFDRAEVLSELLAACPNPELELWALDPTALDKDGPLAACYAAVRSLHKVGPVRASKLMAAKRPRLVPVRDSVVEAFIGASPRSYWWRPMQQIVSNEAVRRRLEELSPDDLSDHVSILRRLDVVLWMEGNAGRRL